MQCKSKTIINALLGILRKATLHIFLFSIYSYSTMGTVVRRLATRKSRACAVGVEVQRRPDDRIGSKYSTVSPSFFSVTHTYFATLFPSQVSNFLPPSHSRFFFRRVSIIGTQTKAQFRAAYFLYYTLVLLKKDVQCNDTKGRVGGSGEGEIRRWVAIRDRRYGSSG